MEDSQSTNRNQIEMYNLDDQIEKENTARFVDAFADKLELNQLGFVVNEIQSEGRPAFNPKAFLKIYL